jgi:protein involved in polysaccharide export with SLBB domain
MKTPSGAPRAAVSALTVLVALTTLTGACGGGKVASTDLTQGPSMLMATRSELQDFVARMEAAQPSAESDSALQLLIARERLATGDFKLDDRVILYVDGEPTLSDTFAVDGARQLTLPGVGPVALAGVLRSELDDKMRQEISRIVRQPVVRTRALVRIGVIGAVRLPGFHWVPADGQVADPITVAGGYLPEAVQADQRVERGGETILAGDALSRALQMGQTLDQAGLQSGDQFVIPERSTRGTYELVRTVGLLLSIPITIYTLIQIFGQK